MKLFDLDWQNFIARLAVWRQLPLTIRRQLAELRPNDEMSIDRLGAHGTFLIEHGFVEVSPKNAKARLAKSCLEFGRAIRAMIRHDILENATSDSLLLYVRDHFTSQDVYNLARNPPYSHSIHQQLLPEVLSTRWVEGFLAKSEMPTRKKPSLKNELPPWLTIPTHNDAPAATKTSADDTDEKVAGRLVRHLMDSPEPIPFEELSNRWDDVPTRSLGKAILLGVGHLVLFPMMRQSDMTPMLGLWPAISRRLHRPRPKPPTPVKLETAAQGAFLVEDMITTLVAAATKPLRLRGNDAALFAKAEQEIHSNLMSIPTPYSRMLACPPDARVRTAMHWIQMLGFAKRAGTPGDDLRLEATAQGEQWLSESAKGRVQAVLDLLLSTKKKPSCPRRVAYGFGDTATELDDPDNFFDDDEDDEFDSYGYYDVTLDILPSSLPISDGEKRKPELRQAAVAALSEIPEDTFVSLNGFLLWQKTERNPLPSLFAKTNGPGVYSGWSHRTATPEEMECLWSDFLLDILCRRMLPLGCVRIGTQSDPEDVYVSLTGPGRYLLGLTTDFDYGHDHDSQDKIIVQPNFDVVFLAPSPLAEASLARFAERKSRGVGSLFRITKKSIFAASGSGATADQAIETLSRLSAKPVPANVVREIAGWFDQCRRVRLQPAILIHCPDADTAARVAATGGKKAALLTETVVELTDVRAKTELLRKLQSLGIFLEKSVSSRTRRNH